MAFNSTLYFSDRFSKVATKQRQKLDGTMEDYTADFVIVDMNSTVNTNMQFSFNVYILETDLYIANKVEADTKIQEFHDYIMKQAEINGFNFIPD